LIDFLGIKKYLRIDEEEVHLKEGEESLKNRMSENNLGNTLSFKRGVHCDLKSVKYECGQSKNCSFKTKDFFYYRF